MSTSNFQLRFAIYEMIFALEELDTHWDSLEGILRAHLEEIKARPTDPRILNGDYTREELGDDGQGFVQHELNALLKNRALIDVKLRALSAEVREEAEAKGGGSGCFHRGEDICACKCHVPGNILLHDHACCDTCRTCGARLFNSYKTSEAT